MNKDFLYFKEPYNFCIQRSCISVIKKHGDNTHIVTTDGSMHKVNVREYSFEDIVGMLDDAPTASAQKPTARAKKTLDKS